jgi:putative peptide maturation system protein
LIQEEFNKDPIEITDDELQQGIDGFRRKYKLYTMETTHQWLEARGMSHAQLERVVTDNLAISKLRGRIAEGREDAYFEAHRSDFDTAFVAQIECASAERAEFLYQQLLRHETEFLEVALDCIRSDVAQYGKQTYPVFLNLLRGQAPEGFSGIFSAKPGDLVSPFSSSDRYIVARVVSVTRGTLSESTRALIQERLFDEWLAERRRTAKIVWCWGNSERTS